MTNQSKNVENLRRAYQTWHDTKGLDTSSWLALFADDVGLTSLAGGAPGAEFSRARTGRAALVGYFDDIAKDWSMLSFDMRDFIEQDDRVVAIGRCSWKSKKTGKTVDTPKVDIWRFRDGKAVEFSEFYDTAQVFGAAS